MSIPATIAQLQMLHRGIDGVKLAPEVYPGSLNAADLPLVLVWPGRATTQALTAKGALQKTERLYSVRVYVDPVGQNNYDAPAQESIALLGRFLDCYLNNTSLMNGYIQIERVSDSGPTSASFGQTPLLYAGNAYRGFTCDLSIIEVCK